MALSLHQICIVKIQLMFTCPTYGSTIFLLLLVISVATVGCGAGNPKTYSVQGRVISENGLPFEMGSVEFRSEGNQSRVIARGKIQSNGSFTLSTFAVDDGAIAGQHDVIVQQMIISEGLGASHEHGPRVPASYSEYATSGLVAKVEKKDKNFVTLMLKPKILQ